MKLVAIILLVLIAAPSFGGDATTIFKATGEFRHTGWFWWRDADWCHWNSGSDAVTEFHATNADGWGPPWGCERYWMIHCSEDSLVYHGEFVEFESSPYWSLWSNSFESEIECTVEFLTETNLKAIREVEGYFTEAEHRISIQYPDGSTEWLIAPGDDIGYVELTLQPAIYKFVLHVSTLTDDSSGTYPYPAYLGRLKVVFEEAIPLVDEGASWGTIKSLYR